MIDLNTIGCDEVGRGPLAGPVLSVALIVNDESVFKHPHFSEVNDSKLLGINKRTKLAHWLMSQPGIVYAIGMCSESEIDEINIHRAALESMRKAIIKLINKIDYFKKIVIDGRHKIPDLGYSHQAIIRGDQTEWTIAAASIIAKVLRDNYMINLSKKIPNYHFEKHKGYPTLLHRKMIKKYGLSSVHRRSFHATII